MTPLPLISPRKSPLWFVSRKKILCFYFLFRIFEEKSSKPFFTTWSSLLFLRAILLPYKRPNVLVCERKRNYERDIKSANKSVVYWFFPRLIFIDIICSHQLGNKFVENNIIPWKSSFQFWLYLCINCMVTRLYPIQIVTKQLINKKKLSTKNITYISNILKEFNCLAGAPLHPVMMVRANIAKLCKIYSRNIFK